MVLADGGVPALESVVAAVVKPLLTMDVLALGLRCDTGDSSSSSSRARRRSSPNAAG
jgi:hypothetical protein